MWREYDSSTTCVTDLGSGIPKTKIHKYWKPWLPHVLGTTCKTYLRFVASQYNCKNQKANTQVIMSHAMSHGVAYISKPSSMLCAVCQSQLSLPQWEWCPTVGLSCGRAVQWCLANPLYCQRSINPRSM